MSKFTVFAIVGATLVVAACSRPAPPPPAVEVQPVVVEPVASKGKY